MKAIIFVIAFFCLSITAQAAEDNIEVETTRIKANKEQPKVLYVVPWKEMENTKNTDQKLVLHNFFGDLYDPVLPSKINREHETTKPTVNTK